MKLTSINIQKFSIFLFFLFFQNVYSQKKEIKNNNEINTFKTPIVCQVDSFRDYIDIPGWQDYSLKKEKFIKNFSLKSIQLGKKNDEDNSFIIPVVFHIFENSWWGDVHDEVVALHPLATSQTAAGTPALDLPKALKACLAADGISEISDLQICTVESADYFSYRRDGITGRQVGLVSL